MRPWTMNRRQYIIEDPTPRTTVIMQPPGPTTVINPRSTNGGFSLGFCTAVMVACVWAGLNKNNKGSPSNRSSEFDVSGNGDSLSLSPPPPAFTTMVKVAVSMSVSDRDDSSSILSVLQRLAETSDTESRFGVQELTNEVALELLRRSSSITAASAKYEQFKDLDEGDRAFAETSVTERSKFDKETVSTFNGVRLGLDDLKQKDPSQFRATMAVVELIVMIDEMDSEFLPSANTIAGVKSLLTKISSAAMVGESLQGAEILWSPADRKDNLTEKDIVTDYPELQPL